MEEGVQTRLAWSMNTSRVACCAAFDRALAQMGKNRTREAQEEKETAHVGRRGQ